MDFPSDSWDLTYFIDIYPDNLCLPLAHTLKLSKAVDYLPSRLHDYYVD